MKSPILRVSFFFGLVCGCVAFSFFLFLYWKGADPLGEARVADLFSSFLFVVAAIWYFRRVIGGGWLHFWQAVPVGFLTNLFGALVSAVLIQLFITQIDTQVLPNHLLQLERMLVEHQRDYETLAGEANFQKQLAQTRLTKPMDMFWDELIRKVLIVGIFPVLLVSILLRKQTYSLLNPGETPVGPPVKKRPAQEN